LRTFRASGASTSPPPFRNDVAYDGAAGCPAGSPGGTRPTVGSPNRAVASRQIRPADTPRASARERRQRQAAELPAWRFVDDVRAAQRSELRADPSRHADRRGSREIHLAVDEGTAARRDAEHGRQRRGLRADRRQRSKRRLPGLRDRSARRVTEATRRRLTGAEEPAPARRGGSARREG